MADPTKPLEIDSYEVTDLHLESVRGATEDDSDEATSQNPVSVRFDFFRHATEHTRFAAMLHVSTVLGKHEELLEPYRIRMSVIGFYTAVEPLPDDGSLPTQLAVNGLTILYGVVRGIVSTSSAWMNRPPAMLPTVCFSPLVAERFNAGRKGAESQGTRAIV